MSDVEKAPLLVRRYLWDEDDEDAICVDRADGRVVVRYDLGDPANYSPAYGGWSKSEWLQQKGLDPDAEIETEKCRERPDPSEAASHAAAKERRKNRDQEEAEALELMSFLGDEATKGFSFEDYQEAEDTILRPALEARGYTAVGFYMIEQDSFGPLIRGAVANCHCGKRVRFHYG